jgi:hypothetical protein
VRLVVDIGDGSVGEDELGGELIPLAGCMIEHDRSDRHPLSLPHNSSHYHSPTHTSAQEKISPLFLISIPLSSQSFLTSTHHQAKNPQHQHYSPSHQPPPSPSSPKTHTPFPIDYRVQYSPSLHPHSTQSHQASPSQS